MIRATQLHFSYGASAVFNGATFSVSDNDKVGIVGVNGAGKTTLFKLILKELQPESGSLVVSNGRIGYLPQEISFEDKQKTVWDYLYEARPIRELEAQLEGVYDAMASASEGEYEALMLRMEKLQARLDRLDVYEAESQLLELIAEMKIDDAWLDRPLGELSGGQKSKVAFAHVLFSMPEILMLDEPTNHLDAATRAFVVAYLKKYKGCVLTISHDVRFLDETAGKILFVNKTTGLAKVYEGNYTAFKRRYAEEELQRELRISQQEREIKKLSDLVAKARQASRTNHNLKRLGKDREIKLERAIAALEKRDATYKRVKLNLMPKRASGDVPVAADSLSFHYPFQRELYGNLSFSVRANERFLIVGENGAGKSTLLKLLVGALKPEKGRIEFSQKTDLAYYAQELELLDAEKTVLENVSEGDFDDGKRRNVLGNFLFSGGSVFKKVGVLSPGEKARVALCKTLMSGANLLLLDEPTNHLDPDTQAVIGENFRDYPATLIVVSHNPAFVEQIGITRMLLLPEGSVIDYTPELLSYYHALNSEYV